MYGFGMNDWKVPFNDWCYIDFEDSPANEVRSDILEDGSCHDSGPFQSREHFGFREHESAFVCEFQAIA